MSFIKKSTQTKINKFNSKRILIDKYMFRIKILMNNAVLMYRCDSFYNFNSNFKKLIYR